MPLVSHFCDHSYREIVNYCHDLFDCPHFPMFDDIIVTEKPLLSIYSGLRMIMKKEICKYWWTALVIACVGLVGTTVSAGQLTGQVFDTETGQGEFFHVGDVIAVRVLQEKDIR